MTPGPAVNSAPPPLSPSYVKATIADLTASRRALGARLDRLNLFTENMARADDPVEIQLLFAARDDYLAAPTAGAKTAAMQTMARILADSRGACADVAKEMNRLLVAAMAAETAQRKIAVVKEIAERRLAKNPSQPTLADLIREAEEENPDAEPEPAPVAEPGSPAAAPPG